MKIKLYYTLGELAKAANMDRETVKKLLWQRNIPYQYKGNRAIFFISDISAYAPDIYASLLILLELRDYLEIRRKDLLNALKDTDETR